MTSTDTHAPSGRSTGPDQRDRYCIRVLNAALTVGCENGLDIVAVCTSDRRITITVQTEADVRRWATALGGDAGATRRTEEPDLGIAVTAATVAFDGYEITVQHTFRAPTISERTSTE